MLLYYVLFMKSFQRTLLFSALVFQKRCKGRAFFHIMQIYAAIFLHFYCIFFAFVANMQKNRHVAKHTFHDKSRIARFYIPYYNICVCKIRHEYHLNLSIHALFHYQSIGTNPQRLTLEIAVYTS